MIHLWIIVTIEQSSEEDTILKKSRRKYIPGKDEKTCIVRFPREFIKIAKILMEKGGGYDFADNGFLIPIGTLELIRLEEIPFSIYRPRYHQNRQNHYRRPWS